MQSDNLDSFERLVFSIPDSRKLILANSLASIVFGTITYFAIEGFTGIELDFFSGVSLVVFIYFLPALLGTETLNTFVSNIKRNWALLLSLVNQGIVFLFSIIITAANNVSSAWSVLWLSLITVYLFSFLVLTIASGREYLKRIAFLSAVQPIAILASFHLFLGRRMLIPIETYILNFLLLVFAALLLLIVVFVVEYLIGSNVSNISAFNLTSTLLQNEKEGMDLGYPAEIDVQTLEIEDGDRFRFAVPWVHPGPIAGFGGGDLTQDFIRRLNLEGEGFFLHVPSTHHADLVRPEDKDKLYDALTNPDKSSTASKLHHKDIKFGDLYGRSFGYQKIIYLDIKDYDDFEISIIREAVDLENTMVIDLHREDNAGERKVMYYSTSLADTLEKKVKKFEEELEELEQFEYQAGKAVDLENRSKFALVEEVDGEKVLIAGFDSNGVPEELYNFEEEIKSEYDEVLFLSTDTHSSLKEMAEQEEFNSANVRKVVDRAEKDVEDASIGFASRKSDKVNVLREDYQGLIFSINILIRLLPIALILMYIGLVIWLL